ncbi:MAG TPA: SDR family oxidoreductase, partial [Bacillota bacterium]|nr:SDR family oxidoreductase [Bacillota bacterium]
RPKTWDVSKGPRKFKLKTNWIPSGSRSKKLLSPSSFVLRSSGSNCSLEVVAFGLFPPAISNFTQWLAMHFAPVNIRVNAIAPGFFLTAQNQFLLTDQQTGALTNRGKSIIAHTPMARFGKPEDLNGTLLWLISDASAFVTGVVIPVDGGFSAYSGV